MAARLTNRLRCSMVFISRLNDVASLRARLYGPL